MAYYADELRIRDTSPWVICPSCRGNGTHVNPSIDANGLTAEDFADDPSFADDYFTGNFDVSCRHCIGSGKVRESYLRQMDDDADDRRTAAMENGDFEAYSCANDPRW